VLFQLYYVGVISAAAAQCHCTTHLRAHIKFSPRGQRSRST